MKGVKGKRLIVFRGAFKIASKLFDEGELNKYKEEDTIEYIYDLLYNWGKGKYVEEEKRKLSEKECRELNKSLIDKLVRG